MVAHRNLSPTEVQKLELRGHVHSVAHWQAGRSVATAVTPGNSSLWGSVYGNDDECARS